MANNFFLGCVIAPTGRGVKFTQPGTNFFAHICTYILSLICPFVFDHAAAFTVHRW